MASGAGKTPQPAGPGSISLNGAAADLPNIEQELYDYQMHSKMCKKIAQLTKVIYSLNTKNEEQEAALQAIGHAHQEELRRVAVVTSPEGEESVLRTHFIELQESLAQVQADFESYRGQAEERDRGVEADLRRGYEEKIQALELKRQEAQAQLIVAQDESLQLRGELERAMEAARNLELQCEELRSKGEEEGKKEEEMERMQVLSEEVKTLREEKEEREGAMKEEREKWERRLKEVREEKDDLRRSMELARRQERQQWEEREEEERRGLSTVLRERVRKAEGEVEGSLQRLNDSKRHAAKLQERIQDLEEELESGRRRVLEAEGGAKRAWEELAVAKERLLLQEDELQTKSEELLSRGVCEGCVCVNVEELKSQVSKLQSRNRELELQSSGRHNDHVRQIRQHAEALASLRSEMVRAQSEELHRERKHAEQERERMQKEMEVERDRLQKEMEVEKERLVKEKKEVSERLQKSWEGMKEGLLKERQEDMERVQKEMEEERGRVLKEMEEERGRVQKEMEETESLKQRMEDERTRGLEQVEEEKKRLAEQAEEEKKRLKDQVKRAIEEVMRRHAAELHNAQEALKRTQEVCGRVQEDRRNSEEMVRRLEMEREELRDKLQHATNQIWRLECVIQQRQEDVTSETPPPCGIHCSRLKEELQHTQEEMQRQGDRFQREISAITTDRQRLEERVLALSQQNHQNTDRNVLDHNRENAEARIQAECEERLRAEFKVELDTAVATSNQREQELQTQLVDLRSQVERKAGPVEGHHGDSEIDRLRREVQETREMNHRLREQLKEEPRLHLKEERHTVALQAMERRAQEELQTERNRLHTLHQLQLDKQRAELSQQHTEWSRQLTQRHMKQIEDLQAELNTHTQMMALHQDLKQQNQLQVFQRQLDESRCAVQELQRENNALKEQLRSEEVEGREEEREEAQRLRLEIERLRGETETAEEAHKQREERRLEVEEERRREEEKRRQEEEEKRREEVEEVKRDHRRELQTLVCDYSSAQTELQARIVALETELREREERCRKREVSLCDDLQIGRLLERLTERDQLIKRLLDERHQQQLHPPVAGDNGTFRLHDNNRQHPGNTTPTMRRKHLEESPPRVTSTPNLLPHDSPSSCHPQHPCASSALPYASSSLPRSSPSLPRTPRSPSMEHSGRSPPSRILTPLPPAPPSPPSRILTPLPPAPTTPLPLCPSPNPEPRHGIRQVTSTLQELRPKLHSQPSRSPHLEPRGTGQGAEGRDSQRQEWYTKYFSF
ncbi:protein FAM184B isoform X2 [Esox lucius]|uniref:Family with sequence similarity 184 member B n=1 Tax=Esox lucius TaxID=8010 RepID=A0A3P8XQ42_ESOLU|nr:protein FAM184B isoform X2 [Esox lucius]